MSSYLGKNLHVSIFGQSHAPAIGVTVDGLPAGERVDLEELDRFLQRRAPGRDATATPRKEADKPRFLCGLVDGVTCGAPLAAVIENTNLLCDCTCCDFVVARNHNRLDSCQLTFHYCLFYFWSWRIHATCNTYKY